MIVIYNKNRKMLYALLIRCSLILTLLLFFIAQNILCVNASSIDSNNIETVDDNSNIIREIKPQIICVDDIQKNVIIEWNTVDGASKYIVYCSNKKNGAYKIIKETSKFYYNDKKAKKRKTYYYKVKAIKELINSDGDVAFVESKLSDAKKIYVRPKKPKMVLCGECYVEGIQYYASKHVPNNMSMVCKVGINTTNILKQNYFDGKTAIQEVCSRNPDRVYFLVGANEFMNNTPKYTVNNLKKIRKILIKNNPDIEIVLIKISPQGKNGKDRNKVAARKKYNKAYKNFANKYKNVYFCNVTDFMDDGLGTLSPNCDAGDGCHWTPYAANEMMVILKQWSEKILGSW